MSSELSHSKALMVPSPLLYLWGYKPFSFNRAGRNSNRQHTKCGSERPLLYLSENSLMDSHQREGQYMHVQGLNRDKARRRNTKCCKCLSRQNISASTRPWGREKTHFNEHHNLTKMFSVSISDNFANFIVNKHREILSDSIALIW